ncbi:MAG: hypothetical protein ACRCT8_15310 [Lacipirellulaceae bacterium]
MSAPVRSIVMCGLMTALLAGGPLAFAQDAPAAPAATESSARTASEPVAGVDAEAPASDSTTAGLEQKAKQALDAAGETVGAVAGAIDEDQRAKDATAGVLWPIYRVADNLSFPAFHWLAFAILLAGVVSFALQLTLGKLIVLSRFGFSPGEILSDALGLVVSLVGLVLATQAAAQNSTFTQSASAVLSATAAGAIAGFILYVWGQRQELQAVEGRRRRAPIEPEPKK